MKKYFDAAARSNFKLSHSDEIYTNAHVIDEQLDEIDSLVEDGADDVDLTSFNIQKRLNPKVWDGHILDKRIRLRLLDIATDFFESLNINWVQPQDVILTGSLANYNWSEFSDFDLHILVDFNDVDERTDLVRDYFNAKKNEWNSNHDELTIYGYPVEVYVQDINEKHTASGIFSIYHNDWLVVPDKNNIRSLKKDKDLIRQKSYLFMSKIDSLEQNLDNADINDDYALRKIYISVRKLAEKLKGIRKASLEKSGEMSVGNIIYKVLRRTGYLDKLWDLRNHTYDKLKSFN